MQPVPFTSVSPPLLLPFPAGAAVPLDGAGAAAAAVVVEDAVMPDGGGGRCGCDADPAGGSWGTKAALWSSLAVSGEKGRR